MDQLTALLERIAGEPGPVTLLTGAGISAESGIPTFRGKEGYWVVGSREYHPQELATRSAFERLPEEVWRWYLYRWTVCRDAAPNGAHLAVAELEDALGDELVLVTQNVDGLHLRAGNSLQRTYQIHGNLDYMRCVNGCGSGLSLLPASVPRFGKDTPLDTETAATLHCDSCRGWYRPHVLWFDESYDEELYRFESSLDAAARCRLLITVGTTAATNLPNQMVAVAARRGVPIIDINPEPNPFSEIAEATGGLWIKEPASEALPRVCGAIAEAAS
jgi:NAD-dependent deacetylase